MPSSALAEVTTPMSGQIQYGSVRPTTSELTVITPGQAERTRRVQTLRQAVDAVSDRPTAADCDRLVQLADTLGLPSEEIAEELAFISALRSGAALLEQIATGTLPLAVNPVPPAPNDRCYLGLSVRFGRRRADQFGHLMLTANWMKFRGALEVSIQWGEVARVTRVGREVAISLRDSRRVLQFLCASVDEAVRGAILAQHLAGTGRERSSSSAKLL